MWRPSWSGDVEWQDDVARESFYIPHSMTTSDSLHALFNALEDAFKTSEAWPVFEPIFRDLLVFFGDKKMRDRFLAVCMSSAPPADRRIFHQFEGSKFEWRFWGNLEDQSRQLSGLWKTMVKYWNFEAMSRDGELDSASLRIVTRAVENRAGDLPGIEAMINAVSVVSQAIGYCARCARGCRCHSCLPLDSPTYQKRRRFMKELEESVDGICMWAGRNGTSLALGAVEDMCKVASDADSTFCGRPWQRAQKLCGPSLMPRLGTASRCVPSSSIGWSCHM
jgi:hypothetical protein